MVIATYCSELRTINTDQYGVMIMHQQNTNPISNPSQTHERLQESIQRMNEEMNRVVQNDCFGNFARGLVKSG